MLESINTKHQIMEETTKLFESELVIIHGLCFEGNCPPEF
jgi:hypothetical protein